MDHFCPENLSCRPFPHCSIQGSWHSGTLTPSVSLPHFCLLFIQAHPSREITEPGELDGCHVLSIAPNNSSK